MAELVSNVKGGSHVAATLLIESPDELELLVAKNEGFNEKDKKFLRDLEGKLRAIAAGSRGYPLERQKSTNLYRTRRRPTEKGALGTAIGPLRL